MKRFFPMFLCTVMIGMLLSACGEVPSGAEGGENTPAQSPIASAPEQAQPALEDTQEDFWQDVIDSHNALANTVIKTQQHDVSAVNQPADYKYFAFGNDYQGTSYLIYFSKDYWHEDDKLNNPDCSNPDKTYVNIDIVLQYDPSAYAREVLNIDDSDYTVRFDDISIYNDKGEVSQDYYFSAVCNEEQIATNSPYLDEDYAYLLSDAVTINNTYERVHLYTGISVPNETESFIIKLPSFSDDSVYMHEVELDMLEVSK